MQKLFVIVEFWIKAKQGKFKKLIKENSILIIDLKIKDG
jgi:hypothetical protein